MNAWHSMVRPCLLTTPPLVWVDNAHVHWGDDPHRIPVTSALIRWVHGLDGTATLATVLATAPGPPGSAELLLSAGYRCGHITDAAAVPVRWFWGDDRDRVASLSLTHLLLAESSGTLTLGQVNELVDARGALRVRIHDPHDHLVGLTASLEAAGLHVSPPPGMTTSDVHVNVLCGHPDVAHDADGRLLEHDARPSLHIGLGSHTAVVGPLVIPGDTACLRCAHLHQRDRDPHWPLRAVQWAQRDARRCSTPASPVTSWACHVATTLVSVWSDARVGYRSAATWRNVAYRLAAHTVTPEREARPPHPLCGCTWADPG